jgi:alpha/beta hydrolase fold
MTSQLALHLPLGVAIFGLLVILLGRTRHLTWQHTTREAGTDLGVLARSAMTPGRDVSQAQPRGEPMSATCNREVRLADGRILQAQITGAADGQAVFLLHGALGSRLVHDPLAAAAADVGIRLLSYDRPGYGGSTPQPGRTVADTAADVAAIADQLGVDRLAVWGESGGCPFAPPCCLTEWPPPRRCRPWRPTRHQGWIGSPAWPTMSPKCTAWRSPGATRSSRRYRSWPRC